MELRPAIVSARFDDHSAAIRWLDEQIGNERKQNYPDPQWNIHSHYGGIFVTVVFSVQPCLNK